MAGELSGGRVNYYLAPVKHPQREDQLPYTAECEDIIQALNMDFNEACEFKAIWRTASARLGNGKPDHKALYDAQKRLHYAGRSVRQLTMAADVKVEPTPEEEGWLKYLGKGEIPKSIFPGELVQVKFTNGSPGKGNRRGDGWDWKRRPSEPCREIAYFRSI